MSRAAFPQLFVMLVASLFLTSPLLLGGLLLASLPLVAHWLQRQSPQRIVFPSIALLVQSLAQQSRFHRLKRWVLLALRLLTVACIVLAFTRPVWLDASASTPLKADQAAAVVVILDASASTGQVHDGVTELESLKGAASRVLDDLQAGVDLAGLVVADSSPHTPFSRLTANVSELRAELGRVSPTAERADFAAAIAIAGRLLAPHDGPRRLVILSDLQRDNWLDTLAQGGLGELLPSSTTVQVVPRPRAAPRNLSLVRPTPFPAAPLAGEPFDLSVIVRNHSDSPQQAALRCERTAGDGGGELLGREEMLVTLGPREERPVTFRADAFAGARQFVQFQMLGEDALAIDDAAWCVIQPASRTPILIVTDDDPRQPGSAAYYLERALAPDAERRLTTAAGASRSGTVAATPRAAAGNRFSPACLAPRELTPQALQAAPVVVVGYVGVLPPETCRLLTEFVTAGGGLIFLAGEGPVERNLQTLAESAGDDAFLPWQPGPRRTRLAAREPLRLGGGRWQSRWLRAFDEQSQLTLQEILFQQAWTTGTVAPDAEILLTFADSTPALGLRHAGRGVVLVANFSPESTSSDLARHGAFVALIQMLVQGAMPPGEAQRSVPAGIPFTWPARFPLAQEGDLSVRGPTGERSTMVFKMVGEELEVTLPVVSAPGLYQLEQRGNTVDAFVCGLDAREGDLQRIAAADVERELRAKGLLVAGADPELGALPPLRGQPLWGACFTAALCAMGLELLLLGLWRH